MKHLNYQSPYAMVTDAATSMTHRKRTAIMPENSAILFLRQKVSIVLELMVAPRIIYERGRI